MIPARNEEAIMRDDPIFFRLLIYPRIKPRAANPNATHQIIFLIEASTVNRWTEQRTATRAMAMAIICTVRATYERALFGVS